MILSLLESFGLHPFSHVLKPARRLQGLPHAPPGFAHAVHTRALVYLAEAVCQAAADIGGVQTALLRMERRL
jgi:hypothetical protein